MVKQCERLYCPVCDITRTGIFCRTCGGKLIPLPPNDPKCPKCGREVDLKWDVYCSWCGEKIKG